MTKKKKSESTYGNPDLPHPEMQKTLLEMKAKGMLEPEVLKKVSQELRREKVVQKALAKYPKLTRKEALEMLEEHGF